MRYLLSLLTRRGCTSPRCVHHMHRGCGTSGRGCGSGSYHSRSSSGRYSVNAVVWLAIVLVWLRNTDGATHGGNHHEDSKPEDVLSAIDETVIDRHYTALHFKPISKEDFESHVATSDSYYDMLRVFYGDDIPDYVIRDLLNSGIKIYQRDDHWDYPAHHASGSGGKKRPRIGAPVYEQQPSQVKLDKHYTYHMRRHPHSHHKQGLQRGKEKHQHMQHDAFDSSSSSISSSSSSSSSSIAHSTLLDIQRATQHQHEMSQYGGCGAPVPEVITMSEVMRNTSYRYVPTCTIIHRCRKNYGCCNDRSRCTVQHAATVERTFFVFKNTVDGIRPAGTETLTFMNHTQCHCKPYTPLPTCKKCVAPFRAGRRRTECVCVCAENNNHFCRSVKRGARPIIDEQDLRCLKSGQCAVPPCRYGIFDIPTGYCPAHRETLEPATTTVDGSGEE